MRTRNRAVWSVVALLLLLGVAFPSTAKPQQPPLAVIVNRKADVDALGPSELRAIFTVSQKRWSNGTPIVPFNYKPKTPLRVQFDWAVLDMGAERVAKFWIDQRIRGKARPPKHVPNVRLMGRVVAALRGAIGYVPIDEVPAGVDVAAYIVDGKVVTGNAD